MNSSGSDSNGSDGKGRNWIVNVWVPILIAVITAGAVVWAAFIGRNESGGESPVSGGSTTSETEPGTGQATPSVRASTNESATSTTGATPDAESERSQPVTAFLADLEPTEGSPNLGAVSVDGTTYIHAVSKDFGGCKVEVVYPYNIGRDWTQFRTTVGIEDNSDADSVVQFEVYADGNLVSSTGNVGYGESRDIEIPVLNVLNLSLRFVFVEGNMGLCSHPGVAVWGDPTLTR